MHIILKKRYIYYYRTIKSTIKMYIKCIRRIIYICTPKNYLYSLKNISLFCVCVCVYISCLVCTCTHIHTCTKNS